MHHRAIPLRFAFWLFLSAASGLVGCSESEDGKTSKPVTIFDSAPPAPRTDEVKIETFIVKLEQKYKRVAFRNAIDLHFVSGGENRIKIKVTYDRKSDPTTASSIADAAVDLAKRLKREDPDMRDIDVIFERDVRTRDE